jgi:FkbM family methyltransferase
MLRLLKQMTRGVAKTLGYEILRNGTQKQLEDTHRYRQLAHILRANPIHTEKLIDITPESVSQLQQDLFVLAFKGFQTPGYFVEFGAADGRFLSNTYLLEKVLNWRGILAEPAKVWQMQIQENRTCNIENRCVWKTSGESLSFKETKLPELSTVSTFNSSDNHEKKRKSGCEYAVETISLEDLLIHWKAPRKIDYLSIDTEGSEFEILKAFPFENWQIDIITCEHNFTSNRDLIKSLLESRGYQRVLEQASLFDDWYISCEMLSGIKK